MNEKLIHIDRTEFASLNDQELALICIQPTIEKIKGKNLSVKSSTFSNLTAGQKSLLTFWILSGHFKHGVIQFLEEINYLIDEIDFWKELKNGIINFDDKNLTNLIDDIESFHISLVNRLLSENEIESIAQQIDSRFKKIIPDSYQLVANYIRDNRSEFVTLINYYCKFWSSHTYPLWNQLNKRLKKWVKWEKGLYTMASVRW